MNSISLKKMKTEWTNSISKIQELRRSKKLDLNECFRVADQISRRCFECKSSETCKWKDEEKIHFEFIELQGET